MLRVSLLGNLGADPELRYSQKGTPITTFRVAVNQVRTGPEGERQEHTEWFRVRAVGRLAEFAQRLTKGGRVLVVGRLEISHFQSREGEPRVGFDVWADEVVNVSPRPSGLEAEAGAVADEGGELPAVAETAPPRANGARRAAVPAAAAPATEELDELPF